MIIRILVYYYAVLLQVLILQQLIITLNLGGGEGSERGRRFSRNLFGFVEGYNTNSGGHGGSGGGGGCGGGGGYRRTSRVRRPIRQRQKSDDYILNNNNKNNNNEQQHYDVDEIKQAQDRHNQALKDPTLLSNSKFQERTDISPKIKRSIIDIMGLQQMTEIQSKTYAAVLKGNCVVGRGRTGTGKTLAFLLPTIERLLAAPLDLYIPGQSIGAVIVAPTRELAIQISKEAETLLTYYHPSMNVACIYGGTKIQRDIRLLSGASGSGGSSGGRLKMPAILVGTPGRLLEHMESNTRIRNKKFQDIISDTQIVVLDEADRLFEGFYKDTTKILSYLPRSNKRQTLLFSATIPKGFMKFLNDKMKLQFTYIDCVTTTTTTKANNNGKEGPKNNNQSQGKSGDIVQQQNRLSTSNNNKIIVGGGKGEETSIRVDQTYYQLQSMDDYITTLVSLIYNHIVDIRETKKDDKNNKSNKVGGCKILVFFPASKLVRFFYQFFHHSGLTEQLLVGGDSSSSSSSMEVLEIHSRMSQSSRQKASNRFRSSTTTNTVLFSSDVSARGVDYPNISLVIQYGAPANVDTYIHRLGRTGRAGQQGKGILVLLPLEKDYLKRIQRRLGRTSSSIQPLIRQEQDDVPFSFSSLTNNDNTDDSNDDYDSNNHKLIIQNLVKQTQLQIRSGHVVLTPLAVSAYSAFLAYYIASANNNNFSLGKNKNKKGGGGGGATSKKLKPSQIVDYANQFAICTGLIGPPILDSKTISRLGIEGLVEVED